MLLIDDAYVVCGATPPVPSRILIAEGRIAAVGLPESVPVPRGAEVIRVFGRRVVAGFVDIHIHGGGGASFMDGTPEAFAEVCRYAARHGTTALLATTRSAPPDRLLEVVSALGRFEGVPDGAKFMGIHLEGPFLSPERPGAHNPDYLRVAALDEVDRLLDAANGKIKHCTLAPELPGALGVIEVLRSQGVTVALGHSSADFSTARRAISHGASIATHVFDCMPPLHHRELSITSAAVTDDRVVAEVIADGHHIHPAMIRLLVRAKQPHRVALVSNNFFAAGMPDGVYSRDDRIISVEHGLAYLADAGNPIIAGATVGMERAFANLIQFAGVSVQEASEMASAVPAAIIGEQHSIGSIRVGAQADLVVLDHDGSVWMTLVDGRMVYQVEE